MTHANQSESGCRGCTDCTIGQLQAPATGNVVGAAVVFLLPLMLAVAGAAVGGTPGEQCLGAIFGLGLGMIAAGTQTGRIGSRCRRGHHAGSR